MKKLTVFFAALAILCFGRAFACDDHPIEVAKLPAAARAFIANYFPDTKVSYAKVDEGWLDTVYDLVFVDGSKVEFCKNGVWKEVKCKYAEVPAAIVPVQIRDYVAKNQGGQKIVSIERDKRNYEVELSNGLDLKFDMKFNLKIIED